MTKCFQKIGQILIHRTVCWPNSTPLVARKFCNRGRDLDIRLTLEPALYNIWGAMQSHTLAAGDKIQVQRFLYRHVGIYLGPRLDGRCVAHNDKKTGVVILSTFEKFLGGSAVSIEIPAPADSFARTQVVQRALSLLGTKYDLWKFNCEHYANYSQTGKATSPQLSAAFALAAIVLGLYIISD